MRKTTMCLFVFWCWMAGGLGSTAVYIYKFLGPTDLVRIDPAVLLLSAGSVFGFLMPELIAVGVWYLERATHDNMSFTRLRGLVLCGASALFHLGFVVLLAYGIVYLGFDGDPNGEAVLQNTRLLLSISTVASPLAGVPVALLFKR